MPIRLPRVISPITGVAFASLLQSWPRRGRLPLSNFRKSKYLIVMEESGKGVQDARPKRRSAGNRLPGIMEALKEEVDEFSDAGSLVKMDGMVGKHEVTEARNVDDLEGECEALEAEIKKLKLEERKKRLTEELGKLKANASRCSDPVQGHRTEGQVRQDGGAHQGKLKHRNYLDFMWVDALDVQTQTVELADGVYIDVGKKKKDFSKVSLDMWVYANLGLVRDMIKSSETNLHEVDDYLKYFQDICRFSAKYIWSSVLLYDQEYRVRQEAEGMRWDISTQDTRDYQLVPKAKA